MGRRNNGFYCLSLWFLCFVVLSQFGCTVASALRGRPGSDVNMVMVGMSRAKIEQVLGPPIRQFVSSGGVYHVYDYDAGEPPTADAVLACVFLDVITVGLWELIALIGDVPVNPRRDQMAVSFDISETVIRVFDHFGDFDALSNNGNREDKQPDTGRSSVQEP